MKSISHNNTATNGIVEKLKSERKCIFCNVKRCNIVHRSGFGGERNLFDGVRLSGADLWIRIRRNVINDVEKFRWKINDGKSAI